MSDLPEPELPEKWFPQHIDGCITPLARAKIYPYPAPRGDFWMRGGRLELRADGIKASECRGRVPVLSVGSNRAPLQLRHKFGRGATMPVTGCILRGCDIVYAAVLSYYCAVPATAFPSSGCAVCVNIAWLDDEQLRHMHATEALGVAYDYVRFDAGLVEHGNRGGGDRDDEAFFAQPIYGYQSRLPILGVAGEAVALGGIEARGRCLRAYDQIEMLCHVQRLVGGDSVSLDAWLGVLRASRSERLRVMDILKGHGLKEHGLAVKNPPWEVIEAHAEDTSAVDISDYL